MGNKKYSRPGLFGGTVHYDENGKKAGTSYPGILGGSVHYDENGRKIGTSYPGLLGGTEHFDEKGQSVGHSYPGVLGGTHHYRKTGKKAGYSYPAALGGTNYLSESDTTREEDIMFANPEEDAYPGLFTAHMAHQAPDEPYAGVPIFSPRIDRKIQQIAPWVIGFCVLFFLILFIVTWISVK